MQESSVLVRCNKCSAVNRVAASRLGEGPRCGRCKASLEVVGAPFEVNEGNFEQEVLKWPGAVLVEFWSPRCGICTSVRPFIEGLARRRKGILKVAMINIDREWFLASGFNITATPKFIIYRGGRKIGELDGALPEPELERWIDNALGNY